MKHRLSFLAGAILIAVFFICLAATYIPFSPYMYLRAKGDLITFSGTNIYRLVSSNSNGKFLKVNTATASGFEYATVSAGGTGTVTSVGATSDWLTVGGSPVTGSGTITLNVPYVPQAGSAAASNWANVATGAVVSVNDTNQFLTTNKSMVLNSEQFSTNGTTVSLKAAAAVTNLYHYGAVFPNVTPNKLAGFANTTGILTNIDATLTEGNYLAGVTGGIQTNLDARVATNNGIIGNFTASGSNNFQANTATVFADGNYLGLSSSFYMTNPTGGNIEFWETGGGGFQIGRIDSSGTLIWPSIEDGSGNAYALTTVTNGLIGQPQLNDGTNTAAQWATNEAWIAAQALTNGLAGTPQLIAATNLPHATVTNNIKYVLNTLTASGSNLLVNFGQAAWFHTVAGTELMFQYTTNRLDGYEQTSSVTVSNNSGANCALSWNASWVALGQALPTVLTNGKTLRASFSCVGTKETSVIVGAALQP